MEGTEALGGSIEACICQLFEKCSCAVNMLTCDSFGLKSLSEVSQRRHRRIKCAYMINCAHISEHVHFNVNFYSFVM